MSILNNLQSICNQISPTNETLDELHFENQKMSTQEFIVLINELVTLVTSNEDVTFQCIANLHLADTVGEITTQFSPSLRKIEVSST